MDEVIRKIECADAENIQDLLRAVMNRYRELYPEWKILFLSADQNATDAKSLEMLSRIENMEQKFEESALSF